MFGSAEAVGEDFFIKFKCASGTCECIGWINLIMYSESEVIVLQKSRGL